MGGTHLIYQWRWITQEKEQFFILRTDNRESPSVLFSVTWGIWLLHHAHWVKCHCQSHVPTCSQRIPWRCGFTSLPNQVFVVYSVSAIIVFIFSHNSFTYIRLSAPRADCSSRGLSLVTICSYLTHYLSCEEWRRKNISQWRWTNLEWLQASKHNDNIVSLCWPIKCFSFVHLLVYCCLFSFQVFLFFKQLISTPRPARSLTGDNFPGFIARFVMKKETVFSSVLHAFLEWRTWKAITQKPNNLFRPLWSSTFWILTPNANCTCVIYVHAPTEALNWVMSQRN